MNEIIQGLIDRKSVREFTHKEILPKDKNLILEAAFHAPTAGNQQLYSIIDVTDKTLKEKLSVLCDNQPFIKEAKMVLLFVSDCQKWFRAYEFSNCNPTPPGKGDLMLSVLDAAIAAQNAVAAAESLGIGSCYIGDIMENCEKIRELFSLPNYVFPGVMVVFGYPTDFQKNREKPKRAPKEYIVFENKYRLLDEEETREMLHKRTGKREHNEWMKTFYNRKYNSDFAREMNRSVEEYLKMFNHE